MDELVGQCPPAYGRRLGVADDDDLTALAAVVAQHALAAVAVLDGDGVTSLADEKQRLELRVVEPAEGLAGSAAGAVAVLRPRDDGDRHCFFELQAANPLDAGHRPGDDGLPFGLVQPVVGRHRQRLVVPVAVLVPQPVRRRRCRGGVVAPVIGRGLARRQGVAAGLSLGRRTGCLTARQ